MASGEFPLYGDDSRERPASNKFTEGTMTTPTFIPADEDGELDWSRAEEVSQNDDGSFNLPGGDEPVYTIGEVQEDQTVEYDHPEVQPNSDAE